MVRYALARRRLHYVPRAPHLDLRASASLTRRDDVPGGAFQTMAGGSTNGPDASAGTYWERTHYWQQLPRNPATKTDLANVLQTSDAKSIRRTAASGASHASLVEALLHIMQENSRRPRRLSPCNRRARRICMLAPDRGTLNDPYEEVAWPDPAGHHASAQSIRPCVRERFNAQAGCCAAEAVPSIPLHNIVEYY
jgi:hypothetical protein